MDTARLQSSLHEIAKGVDPRSCLAPLVTLETPVTEALQQLQRLVLNTTDGSVTRSVADRLYRAYPNSIACIDLFCRTFAETLEPADLIRLRTRAVSLEPRDETAILRLADAHERASDVPSAIRVLKAALSFGISGEFLVFKLGYFLALAGEHEQALTHYEAALKRRVTHRTLLNMAVASRQVGDLPASAVASQRAIVLEPHSGDAYYNYANLQRELGDPATSARYNSRAETLDPSNYAVKWNLSHALLAQGAFVDGFRKYRDRWAFRGFPTRVRYKGVTNVTRLEDAVGRVFLYTEQGKGDNILFSRFIPAAIAALPKETTCTVECFPELLSLFRGSFPGVEFIEYSRKLPEGYDYYLPIFDVPELLGLSRVDAVASPYLTAPADGDAPALEGSRPRVGIAWAGNPNFVHDAHRSASLDDLSAVLSSTAVSFYSFQKGTEEGLITERFPHVVDLAPQLQTFADTARLMMEMDVIVSTCTSTANLAGALNKRGLVLVGHMRDWRWMTGSSSDWYPSLKILEKPRMKSWRDFIPTVQTALTEELEGL